MEELKRWWKGLTRREKSAVIILASVAAAFLLHRLFYLPRASALGSLYDQQRRLEQSISELKASLKSLDLETSELDAFEAESALVEKEVGRLEGKVIGPDELNTLLSLLSRHGTGLALEFHTIKQRAGSQSGLYPNAPYNDVTIEVIFESDYAGLAQYLQRIESISPLLKVSEMNVEKPAASSSALRQTQLTLTIPVLKQAGKEKSLSAQAALPPPPKLGRSLFGTLESARLPDKLESIVVSGVSVTPRSKSAIINGEVYRVGDTVEGFTLEDILPNKVLLSDGKEAYSVVLQ